MLGAEQTLITVKYIMDNNITTIGFSPVNSLLLDFGFHPCDYKHYKREFIFQRGKPPVTPTKYWFAVRETITHKQRLLKVLSRRMLTEREALGWAEYHKSERPKNPNHKYFAIQMES